MADPSLEQILQQEYRRIMRDSASAQAAGLLDVVKTSAATQTQPAGRAPKLMAASPTNKGYTLPVPQGTQPEQKTTAKTSVAGAIGKTALQMFTSGLGVMPLVSGIAGLFGGGGSPASTPLVKYAMPRSIQVTAANSRDGRPLSFADYNQDGSVRSFGENTSGGDGGVATTQPRSVPGSSNGPAGQIVVNVQAMDSRSFLDHSHEIAQAVREAMLNMHALNDIVSEL